MIDCLYSCFKHWSDGGGVYIISDPHFDDSDCKLMDSNWPTAQEQVEILKKYVHKYDTLIILGDVGDPTYISQLSCYKVLIKGNHDKGTANYKRNKHIFVTEFDSIEDAEKAERRHEIDYYEINMFHSPFITGYKDDRLFDEVYDGPLFVSDRILLSHERVKLPFVVNIHGHEHGGKPREFNDEGVVNCINVASDVVKWEPINLGSLIKHGLLSGVPTIHRLVIEKQKQESLK